jgi:hypothetical protein
VANTPARGLRPLRDADWVAREYFDDRIKADTVLYHARRGLIPFVRFGKRVLFDEDALIEWRRGGGTGLSS